MSKASIKRDQDYHSTTRKPRKSDSAGHYKTGPGEVACDFCTERKKKAVKSCLSCLASYCESHLQTHYEYPAFMKHKLVNASGQLQDKICSQHDKLLEVYCRTDQQCICSVCVMEDHRSHDTVFAGAERAEKQKQLGTTLKKSQQKIQGRVKKWQDLRQAVESLKHSAQTAADESQLMFTDLIRSIERWQFEVRELIKAQEKAMVSQAEGLLERLEQEIAELRRRHTELEQLSHTDDHIHFLQSWQSLGAPSGYEDIANFSVNPRFSFTPARKAVSEMKAHLEDVLKVELVKISAKVNDVNILQAAEPRSREDFLQYSCQLTLDPKSAHKSLSLSKGNTEVTMRSETLSCPPHPERFDHWQQVLCREGLTGARFYWEVEWRGSETDVAVSYRGINRKGNRNDCSFGWNDKSWSLYCSESRFSFLHNNVSTKIPAAVSSRIGVYLDHRAGTLSFYSVSDTMSLIHKVQTTFTEPLYPGFGVWGYGSTIKLS